ncbi:MAG: hypothetical protein QW213_07160 [Thermoproteota archaeon]|nr:hypothetical protein [Candidatus Rehaiarchaeum fermentans]
MKNTNKNKEKFKLKDYLPSIVRIIFGVVFLSDALLKYLFYSPLLIKENLLAALFAPWGFVYPWVYFWTILVTNNIFFVVSLAMIVESLIGIGLILGIFKKLTYYGGIVFSLSLWMTAAQFGGPYVDGTLNIGSSIFYVLLFSMLIYTERSFNFKDISLDKYLLRKFKTSKILSYFTFNNINKAPNISIISIFSIIFGVMLGISAALKLIPGTSSDLSQSLLMLVLGEPKLILNYFIFWDKLIIPHMQLFLYIYFAVEFIIALFLILRIFKKPIYYIGLAYSLFSWSVIQGFGGPFFPGITDVSSGIIYFLIFLLFIYYEYSGKKDYIL